jgi:hypothetical protein
LPSGGKGRLSVPERIEGSKGIKPFWRVLKTPVGAIVLPLSLTVNLKTPEVRSLEEIDAVIGSPKEDVIPIETLKLEEVGKLSETDTCPEFIVPANIPVANGAAHPVAKAFPWRVSDWKEYVVGVT